VAWASGAEIEWRYFDTDSWMPNCNNNPVWHNDEYEFRIKPQPKEPQYLYVYKAMGGEVMIESKPSAYCGDCIGKIKLEEE
jgi:hypothetical protein